MSIIFDIYKGFLGTGRGYSGQGFVEFAELSTVWIFDEGLVNSKCFFHHDSWAT